MQKDQLTDSDFFAGWGQYILKEEEILWEGRPPFRYIIRFFENDYYHDVITGVSSFTTIYSAVVLLISYNLYQQSWILAITFALAAFLLPFIYEYWRCFTLSKTQYAVTDQFVLFKLFNGIKSEIHAIPLEEIYDIKLVDYGKNQGAVLLIVNQRQKFITYSLVDGTKQDHPTIELNESPSPIYSLIHDRIKIRPLKYQPPSTSQSALSLLRKCCLAIIVMMSIYLIDYYLLPTSSHEDTVEVEIRKFTLGINLGGQYITKQGYSFSTYDFTFLKNKPVLLEHSKLFGITKTVIIPNGINYRLKSSLNGRVTRCLYFITYFLLLANYLRIRNPKSIDQDAFIMTVISSIGTIFVLIVFWILHN